MDRAGKEIQGESRRFHTLRSLSLQCWSEVDARHLNLILDSCRAYFHRKPYGWFKRLDRVVSGAEASYYDASHGACHLDLIPYATERKWSKLTAKQRSSLLDVSGDALGRLLRDSPVRILILNGRSVVEQFQKLAGACLEAEEMPSWSLRPGVKTPVAFKGEVDALSGINLGTPVEAVSCYKELMAVERALRDLKDVMEMRPIYHQTPWRVEAHIFVAALALLLQHAVQRKLKQAGMDLSAEEALGALTTLQLLDLELPDGGAKRLVMRGTRRAQQVLQALGIRDRTPPGDPYRKPRM